MYVANQPNKLHEACTQNAGARAHTQNTKHTHTHIQIRGLRNSARTLKNSSLFPPHLFFLNMTINYFGKQHNIHTEWFSCECYTL
jgi:hypothetical protein